MKKNVFLAITFVIIEIFIKIQFDLLRILYDQH